MTTITRLIPFLLLTLAGCQLTLGAGTDIGAANVGTAVSLDTETGDVDQSVGASIRIR